MSHSQANAPSPGVVNSSNASASVEQQNVAAARVDSDDPAWAHCFIPNMSKKNAIQCNYCDKICTAGITRIKYHLAGIKNQGVTICKKVPSAVKKEFLALLTQKCEVKNQKINQAAMVRSEINLDHSDGEDALEDDCCILNDVMVINPGRSNSTSNSRGTFGGPMEKFCVPGVEESVKKNLEEQIKKTRRGFSVGNDVQTQVSTQKREEKRDRAVEYICQFFYDASIPHNTVTLPSFALMLEAIGAFGRRLRGPSAYELSGPFLQKRKNKLLDGFISHKKTWEHTGCTVMTDAWTDKKGRGVMNLVVHSANGVLFLDSVDCSSVKKDGKYIFDLVDKCIEDIGEDKVVQVVTDNASVNSAAACFLRAKRPRIFWTGCAAHTIDLMLEDIGKLGPVQQTIARAREVTVFLYAHTRVLALMRNFLGKDLVRSGITRFATAYLNLKSMQDNKKDLRRLFKSDEMEEMGYLSKVKGKKANKVVQSDTFWRGVDMAVHYFEPMANVLRRMDSDIPAMGFLHGCLLEARSNIANRFGNDESLYKSVWDIIDKRWDNKLKTPLHLAGYYLNPYFYYPNKNEIELDGSFRGAVITCVTKLIEDEETQDKVIDELNNYMDQRDSFGTDIATRQRKNKNFDPAKWWLNHGTTSPNLRNLATKILSLTCSSSACERNWSTFEQVHQKKRSRLLHERMRDLVFVKFNSRLKQKREDRKRDPIEKPIEDVLEDEENEFIHGFVPQAEEDAPLGPTQGASTSTSSQTKRKRPAHPRKRKKKSLLSLLNATSDPAVLASSSSSEDDHADDTEMPQRQQSSDSDKAASDNSD